jgi:hypothetical protein
LRHARHAFDDLRQPEARQGCGRCRKSQSRRAHKTTRRGRPRPCASRRVPTVRTSGSPHKGSRAGSSQEKVPCVEKMPVALSLERSTSAPSISVEVDPLGHLRGYRIKYSTTTCANPLVNDVPSLNSPKRQPMTTAPNTTGHKPTSDLGKPSITPGMSRTCHAFHSYFAGRDPLLVGSCSFCNTVRH